MPAPPTPPSLQDVIARLIRVETLLHWVRVHEPRCAMVRGLAAKGVAVDFLTTEVKRLEGQPIAPVCDCWITRGVGQAPL